MRIVGISDSHNWHARLELPEGDVLIHAGDMTRKGTTKEIAAFANWLREQPFAHKLVVSGNHELGLYRPNVSALCINLLREAGATYLQDSAVEIDGVVFYGSPWTTMFAGMAFELPRGSDGLQAKWEAIPDATNVLITHQPPGGTLDLIDGVSHGCTMLAYRVRQLPHLKAHLFGHYHDCGSMTKAEGGITFANCAVLDGDYCRHINRPIVEIEL